MQTPYLHFDNLGMTTWSLNQTGFQAFYRDKQASVSQHLFFIFVTPQRKKIKFHSWTGGSYMVRNDITQQLQKEI